MNGSLKVLIVENQRRAEEDFEPDLSGANIYREFEERGKLDNDGFIPLSNINLSGANMREAIFYSSFTTGGADMRHANLLRVNLENAQLPNSRLNHAVLRGAVLDGAYMLNANLCDAKMSNAHLYRTDLFEADLTNAELNLAFLKKASLSCYSLQRRFIFSQPYWDRFRIVSSLESKALPRLWLDGQFIPRCEM